MKGRQNYICSHCWVNYFVLVFCTFSALTQAPLDFAQLLKVAVYMEANQHSW